MVAVGVGRPRARRWSARSARSADVPSAASKALAAFGQRLPDRPSTTITACASTIGRRRCAARPARCRPACARPPPGCSGRRRTSRCTGCGAGRRCPAARRPPPARRTARRRPPSVSTGARGGRRARPGSGSSTPGPCGTTPPPDARTCTDAARSADARSTAQPGSAVVAARHHQAGRAPRHRCAVGAAGRRAARHPLGLAGDAVGQRPLGCTGDETEGAAGLPAMIARASRPPSCAPRARLQQRVDLAGLLHHHHVAGAVEHRHLAPAGAWRRVRGGMTRSSRPHTTSTGAAPCRPARAPACSVCRPPPNSASPSARRASRRRRRAACTSARRRPAGG